MCVCVWRAFCDRELKIKKSFAYSVSLSLVPLKMCRSFMIQFYLPFIFYFHLLLFKLKMGEKMFVFMCIIIKTCSACV